MSRRHGLVLLGFAVLVAILGLVIWLNPPDPDAAWPHSLDVRRPLIQMLIVAYAGFALVSSVVLATQKKLPTWAVVAVYAVSVGAGLALVWIVDQVRPF